MPMNERYERYKLEFWLYQSDHLRFVIAAIRPYTPSPTKDSLLLHRLTSLSSPILISNTNPLLFVLRGSGTNGEAFKKLMPFFTFSSRFLCIHSQL